MSPPSATQLFAAALYLFTTLVWSVGAVDLWTFRLHLRPRNPMSRLLPWLCSAVATLFAIAIVFALLPPEMHERRPRGLVALFVLQDAIIIVALAMTRHLARLAPLGASRPSQRWLWVNYGLAAVIVALTSCPAADPLVTTSAGQLATIRAIHFVYIVVMLALSVAHVARFAR